MTVTEFPDFGEVDNLAKQISLTGAPPLALATAVVSAVADSNIAAAATVSHGPFAITQTGVEIRFGAQASSNLDNGPDWVTLRLDWTNTFSGEVIHRDGVTVYCGPNGFNNVIIGKGPARANQLIVFILNRNTSTGAINTLLSVIQTSRVYSRMRWRSMDDTTMFANGLTAVGNFPQMGVLGNSNPTVGIGASVTRTLALYNGLAQFKIKADSLTSDLTVSVFDLASVLGNYNEFFNGKTDATGHLYFTVYLPPLPIGITLTNGNAAAKVCRFNAIISELEV